MPPSIDVLTSSSAPGLANGADGLEDPSAGARLRPETAVPVGLMEPRDRERQTASHDARPKQPRLAPEGTRDALRNERPQPRSVGAGSMDRPKGPQEPRPGVARTAASADATTMQSTHRGRT